MKSLLVALMCSLAVGASAQAEIFRPGVVQGAILGATAGAIIGHNDGRHAGEGAAIGAVAGAVIGSVFNQPRRQPSYAPPVPDAPRVAYAPAYASDVVYVDQAPVQYVQAQPRVVYVRPSPVVYVDPSPVIYFGGGGWYSGARYGSRYRDVYYHGGFGHGRYDRRGRSHWGR